MKASLFHNDAIQLTILNTPVQHSTTVGFPLDISLKYEKYLLGLKKQMDMHAIQGQALQTKFKRLLPLIIKHSTLNNGKIEQKQHLKNKNAILMPKNSNDKCEVKGTAANIG